MTSSTLSEGHGRAEACANIALAKYWGKSDKGDNLTAVPSLSLTLDCLRTRTEVELLSNAKSDEAQISGMPLVGRPLTRIVELLDRIRAISGNPSRARVISENNFPTAAGLASSASGFAALACAAAQAFGLGLTPQQLSSQARKASASAGRSLFEGFSELLSDADEAQGLLPRGYWDVAMVVAVIASGPKPIGSTGGMLHTKLTSPYYPAWEKCAPALFEEVKAGVVAKDFGRVAEAMEHSTRLMHATMFTSLPPVIYLKGPTVDLMHEIALQRTQGHPVAYTMDAGPNVKVFTLKSHVEKVVELLKSQPGVLGTIVCHPGPGASELVLGGDLATAQRIDQEKLPPFIASRGNTE